MSHTDDTSWPKFGEELSRKAMEKLDEAVHRRMENEFDDEDLFLVADTLLDMVTGLVPWDVCETIDSVRKASR